MERIKVSLGITKNLGNYESLRIDAEYSVDVPGHIEISDAYDDAWLVVDNQIEDKLLELEATADGKK